MFSIRFKPIIWTFFSHRLFSPLSYLVEFEIKKVRKSYTFSIVSYSIVEIAIFLHVCLFIIIVYLFLHLKYFCIVFLLQEYNFVDFFS